MEGRKRRFGEKYHSNLKDLVAGYVDAMLWAEHTEHDGKDQGSFESCGYAQDDIALSAAKEIVRDCQAFCEIHSTLWEFDAQGNPLAEKADLYAIGQNFYLSRNGHGAGFFDSGMSEARALQQAAKTYGTQGLYLGDNGKLYVHS